MPRPYSADLRERALRACARAETSRAAIARRFEVAEATLYGWLRQEREEGRRAAKPHAGGPAPTIDAAGLEVLRGLVEADRDATLAEYVERYAARTEQRVSVAVMCRTLRRRLGLTRKKRRCGPRSGRGPTSPPQRAAYDEQVRGLDPGDLVFVDEAGVTTAMTRHYGRAPKGRRAVGAAPYGAWRRLTVLGALGTGGVVAAMAIEAATSTAVFLAFLERMLIPELVRTKPGAVVVMDNLSAHKAAAVRERLEGAGLRLLYLPRYAPELSPIEPCWSKVKERLRAEAARSVAALHAALGPALDAVSARDARGFFRGCGYVVAPD